MEVNETPMALKPGPGAVVSQTIITVRQAIIR